MPALSDEDLELLGEAYRALSASKSPPDAVLAGKLSGIVDATTPVARDEAVKRLVFADVLTLKVLAGRPGPSDTAFLRAAMIIEALLGVPPRFR